MRHKWTPSDDYPAEQEVLARLWEWPEVVLGSSRPGAKAGRDVRLRADFIRHLCLYQEDIPEWGVRIAGARIEGKLNLEGAKLRGDLGLVNCDLDTAPLLQSARVKSLFFYRAAFSGLKGSQLQAEGGVFLRQAEVSGAVELLRAKLGGDLDCTGATLQAAKRALSCDGLQAEGNVFLRGATVAGAVRLLGAKLGGNVDCTGATLQAAETALSGDGLRADGNMFLGGATVAGEIRLPGAKLGGGVICTSAHLSGGMYAGRAQVAGNLFLRQLFPEERALFPDIPMRPARIHKKLDLTGAHFAAIEDDRDAWPEAGALDLDRCTYGAFARKAPLDAQARIEWLSLQLKDGEDFKPQPWEQCAKVLREMGHVEDARDVLIKKEQLHRIDRRRRLEAAGRVFPANVLGLWDWMLRVTVRYGHRPLRAFVGLFVFWILGFGFYQVAAHADAIKPNNAFVLRAPEWAGCVPPAFGPLTPGAEWPETRWHDSYASQLACFHDQPEAGSYPKFRAWIYSADTLLPIVHLEMQEFWIPDESAASPLGRIARGFLWLQIAMGWALSLLAVAGFSGLVKSD
ncbi:MAG: hypothetical protein AAGA70_12840 [Pseudomonadota bacterium]